MLGIVTALAAAAAVPLAAAAGRAIGIVDRPRTDGLSIHQTPVPLTGGVGVIGIAVVAWLALGDVPLGWWLAAAAVAALVLGLADDIAGHLPALARIVVLAAAGAVGAVWSVRSLSGGAAVVAAAGVALICLATANGVNLVDGADALAGGTAAASAFGLAAAGLALDVHDATAVAVALGGALIGFLVWNRSPARVFLGNGGAYGVGVVLGAVAGRLVAVAGWRGLAASTVCLGVFAFEIATTIVRRRRAGASVVTGDRAHVYDVLAARTGRRRSTVVVVGIALALALAGAAIAAAPTWIATGLAVLVVVCGLLASSWVAHAADTRPA